MAKFNTPETYRISYNGKALVVSEERMEDANTHVDAVLLRVVAARMGQLDNASCA